MKVSAEKVRGFRKKVWAHYRAHGRDTLPWRATKDPYRILVSEVMLQQTQVERVIPYFTQWMTLFPDVHALMRAPLPRVLRAWQGLGYNRRAKALHQTAKRIVKEYAGVFPQTEHELEALPGIGPYTARAVLAFAHNIDVVCIETNIRTALLHHFFSGNNTVSDGDLLQVADKVFPRGRARDWYAALMDYGAHLKRSGIRLNTRVKGHVKQKTFTGSDREVRGAIIRALVQRARSPGALKKLFDGSRRPQVERQLRKLEGEGMIVLHKGVFRIPS